MNFSIKKKPPTNLIIGEGDPREKSGEPCVVGTRKRAARKGRLLKKFSAPTIVATLKNKNKIKNYMNIINDFETNFIYYF